MATKYRDLYTAIRDFIHGINVEYLSLAKTNSHFLPSPLFDITTLKELHLQHNKISEIPKEIENLINLKILLLPHNRITTLPKELGNINSLEYLYIIENPLVNPVENILYVFSNRTILLNNNLLIVNSNELLLRIWTRME